MDMNPLTAPLQVDEDGRLTQEIACLSCGYLLRGRRMDEACPECGLEVVQSAREDLLQFMPIAWLGRLQRGVNLVLLSVLLSVVLVLVGMVAGAVLVAMASGGGAMPTQMLFVLMAGLGLVPQGCMAVGLWLTTTPKPGTSMGPAAERWRGLCRVGVVTGLAVMTMMLAAQSMVSMEWLLPLSIANEAATAVTYVSIAAYMVWLALRLPDRSLAKQNRVVAWGIGIAMSVGLIGSVMNAGLVLSNTSVFAANPMVAPTPAPPASTATSFPPMPAAPTPPAGQRTQISTQANADGGVTTFFQLDDGTTLTEVRHPDGRLDETFIQPDQTLFHQVTAADGSRLITVTAPNGAVTSAQVSSSGQVTSSSVSHATTSSVHASHLGMTGAWLVAQGFNALGGLGALVFMIWALVLVFLWRGRLARCRSLAEATLAA